MTGLQTVVYPHTCACVCVCVRWGWWVGASLLWDGRQDITLATTNNTTIASGHLHCVNWAALSSKHSLRVTGCGERHRQFSNQNIIRFHYFQRANKHTGERDSLTDNSRRWFSLPPPQSTFFMSDVDHQNSVKLAALFITSVINENKKCSNVPTLAQKQERGSLASKQGSKQDTKC